MSNRRRVVSAGTSKVSSMVSSSADGNGGSPDDDRKRAALPPPVAAAIAAAAATTTASTTTTTGTDGASDDGVHGASEGSKKEKKRHGAFSSWWIIPLFIVINHIIAVPVLLWYRNVCWQIYALFALTGWLALTGVTAGYHRLWSHRSFRAVLPLRLFLAAIGTLSFQGSIKWWVLRHRVHHRFVDTPQDPYSVTRGLWYAHVGWLLEKPQVYEKMDLIDMSDLNKDPVIEWQIKYLGYGYVGLGLIMPALLGWLYGDVWGGIFWIGVMARIVSWNGIWCTNSLAHWIGDRPYADDSTARGSLLCAILCNGEGNHNYHHEFPKDFRHGVKWYEWDPTKWCIMVWSWLGLASSLYRSHPHNIRHAELKVRENTARQLLADIERQRKHHTWGVDPDKMPSIDMAEFTRRVRDEGKFLIIIDGYALDCADFFKSQHPGGPKPLQAVRGKDATAAFYGVLNTHTKAAQHLVTKFRIARVIDAPSSSSSFSSSSSARSAVAANDTNDKSAHAHASTEAAAVRETAQW